MAVDVRLVSPEQATVPDKQASPRDDNMDLGCMTIISRGILLCLGLHAQVTM